MVNSRLPHYENRPTIPYKRVKIEAKVTLVKKPKKEDEYEGRIRSLIYEIAESGNILNYDKPSNFPEPLRTAYKNLIKADKEFFKALKKVVPKKL